jgi:ABC-2 type transport system permease protein
MLPSMKAEFRRLFTVRSTYILIGLSLVLIVFFAFWFEGYKGNTGSPASELASTALHEIVANGVGLGVVFASIVAILFMAHEYRYNTIMYTLTANASRSKALLAKLLTIILFSVAYGLFASLVAILSYLLGLSLRDASLPAQQFNVFAELGRIVFYCTGYALIGMLIATVARSVVVAIAAILIVPTTVEPLLGLLLKENSKYLPFTALDSSVGASFAQNTLSSGNAILVSCAYLLTALAVTWLLFVRRDAN